MIEEKKVVKIHFKDKFDFRKRIFSLWQNQKEDETYEFSFGDKECKKEFDRIEEIFS